MSLLSRFRALVARDRDRDSLVRFDVNPWGPDWRARIGRLSPAELFATQPDLQAVVAFRAREVAALPLHVYRITDAGGYHEKLDGPLRELFIKPNSHMTGYELIRETVATLDLYGSAYWYVFPDASATAGFSIEPLHPTWIVGSDGGTIYLPERYHVRPPRPSAGSETVVIPGANVVRFCSYAPDGVVAIPPLESLKNVLAEQIAAWEFRRQVWQRGGRVGGYVYRPKDAPQWSAEARKRFRENWHEFQRGGARAGETPVFEDGMELRRVGFSAREDEWSEAAKLSLRTVCRVYHVSPSQVGDDSSQTYASAREDSRKLYTSTLAPLIRELEQRLTSFVLPIVDPDAAAEGLAVKFNIDAKLAGSFEEQISYLSTAVGAPLMTTNEGRSKLNLPPTDGGDELVVPLNVLKGGQASPQDGEAPSVAVENARDADERGEDQ